MGQGWRRVSELVRQKTGLTLDKQFRQTTNGRNEAMFREATEFSLHLRQLERDLRALQKQVEGNFGNMRNILLSPLPRAYEEGQNGPAPIEEQPRPIGQNVHVDRITNASQEMKRRLESEVIQPIKEWMVAYRTISDRMRQLESVRLELDSRRRTVSELQGKYERTKSTLGSTGHKGQMLMEQTEKEMVHKENKMLSTLAHYQEMERTVYNSLFTLVKDTSVLRDYAAAALQIVQDCFREAFSAFDPNMPHLEYSTTAAAGYGQLAIAAQPKEEGMVKGLMRQLSDRMLGQPSSNGGMAMASSMRMQSKLQPEYSGTGGAGGMDDRSDPRMAYDQMGAGYGGYDAAQQMGGPKVNPAHVDVMHHGGQDAYGLQPQYSMSSRPSAAGYASHSPVAAARYGGGHQAGW